MKINKYFLGILMFFLISLSVFSILDLSSVQAQSLWSMQEGADELAETFKENSKPTDVRVIIVRVIKIFLTFLGIIFVALIISAGYIWMTAAGNEERVGKAKHQLKTAIIGFVIVSLAYVITVFVTSMLLKEALEQSFVIP